MSAGGEPSRVVSATQLVWALIGVMTSIILMLATGVWTFQQGQLSALQMVSGNNTNRITALEVQVKQLQSQYELINTKLDSIQQRLPARP